MKFVGGFILTALLCAGFLHAQSAAVAEPGRDEASLKAALVAQVNAFMTAWEKQDAVALSGLMAPEFQFVSSRGVAPREGVVAALTHACTLSSYSLSDVQVMRISADAGVVVYKLHQTASCGGHADPPVVMNTDTLVRRGGKWVFLLTTTTPAS